MGFGGRGGGIWVWGREDFSDLQKCKPPTTRVLREVPARNGCSGKVLRKALVFLVPGGRDTWDKHLSKHFPVHPVSGRHLPTTLGIGGFALLQISSKTVKQRGRGRKGPPEIIQKFRSETGRFRVQISL